MIALAIALIVAAQAASDAPAQHQPAPAETAATGSPAETVAAFLSFNKAGRLGTPSARALVGGELTGMTARTLGPLASPDRIIAVNPRLAVARLPATRENPTDIYLSIGQSESGAWTVDAVRGLPLAAAMVTMRNDLIQRVTLSDEEQRTLAQITLMMQSDAELRRWFTEHRAPLDTLRTVAQAEPGAPGIERAIESEAAQAALGKIDASALTIAERGAIVVTLSGIGDGRLGFLFADTPGKLPAIGDDDYIWIEPVGGGWHLFKAT